MKDSIRVVIQTQVVQPTTRVDLIAQAQGIKENENFRIPTYGNTHSNSYERAGGPQRPRLNNNNRYDSTRGKDNRERRGDGNKDKSKDYGNNRAKVSPEKLERRKKKRLCFHCGKGNHVSKDWFSRKKEEREKNNDTSTRLSEKPKN